MRVQITKGKTKKKKTTQERETGNNGGGEARRAAPGRRRHPGRQEEEEAEEEGEVAVAGRGLRGEIPYAPRLPHTGPDLPPAGCCLPPRRAPGRPCAAAGRPTVSDAPAEPADGHRRHHHHHHHHHHHCPPVREEGAAFRRFKAVGGTEPFPPFASPHPENFTEWGCRGSRGRRYWVPSRGGVPPSRSLLRVNTRELRVRGRVRVRWHLLHRQPLSHRCDRTHGHPPLPLQHPLASALPLNFRGPRPAVGPKRVQEPEGEAEV